MDLPPGWKQFAAPDGRPYYVDTSTGVSHWNPPHLHASHRPQPHQPVYHPDGDFGFWGECFDESTGRPKPDKFARLCDGIFFWLDQTVEPRMTNRLEPTKIMHYFASGCPPWGPNFHWLTPVDRSYQVMHALFNCMKVPHTLVEATNPSHTGALPSLLQRGWPLTMVVIDRVGFLRWMMVEVNADPNVMHRILSHFINTFGIIDPATDRRFPPLPRASFPRARFAWTDQDDEVLVKEIKAARAKYQYAESEIAKRVMGTAAINQAAQQATLTAGRVNLLGFSR